MRLSCGFKGTQTALLDANSRACYLPVTPVPIRFGVTSASTTRTATAQVYGWSGTFTGSAVLASTGSTNFVFFGGTGGASAGTFTGGIDDIRLYSSSQSANWADYRDNWTARRGIPLHPTSPAWVVLHIGTSITAGYASFCGDNAPTRIGHRFISNSVHYNFGWAGARTSTMADNVAIYTDAVTALHANFPNAKIMVILEAGANDAGVDGNAVASTSTYTANLTTLCLALRAAGVTYIFKRTSTPVYYGGTSAARLATQTAINSFNAADRTSPLYNSVIDVAADPAFALADATDATLLSMCTSDQYLTGSTTNADPDAGTSYDKIHPGHGGQIKIANIITASTPIVDTLGTGAYSLWPLSLLAWGVRLP